MRPVIIIAAIISISLATYAAYTLMGNNASQDVLDTPNDLNSSLYNVPDRVGSVGMPTKDAGTQAVEAEADIRSTQSTFVPKYPSAEQLLAIQKATRSTKQVGIEDVGIILIADDQTYTISYMEDEGIFFLTITTNEVMQGKIRGSQALASILGVSSTELCEYAVIVTVLPQEGAAFQQNAGLPLCGDLTRP